MQASALQGRDRVADAPVAGAIAKGRGRGRRRQRAWLLVPPLLLACASAAPVQADEVLVSAQPIQDYEFDHLDNLIAFTDYWDRLWVASVDPATGNFVPANGRGTLVDTNAAFATDFGNGPEWVYSAAGNGIVYTRYEDGQPKDGAHAGVAYAQYLDGAWQASMLPDTLGYNAPLGSQDPGDVNPRVMYKGVDTYQFAWRALVPAGDTSNTLVPYGDNARSSQRWVDGMDAIVYSSASYDRSGGLQAQVFLYDTDSQTVQQLTSDDGRKGAVFMWPAPEFDGDYVFFAVVDATHIVCYRQQYDDPTGQYVWAAFATLWPPAGAPACIWSPEPFTYKGKSYIFMSLSDDRNAEDLPPSQIWLMSIDGSVNRQLSDPAITDRNRNDPEWFLTDSGPYIYFNAYGHGALGGVYRSDTGLGPP